MELKQNPFSFYDFLGYLTPGALFLYGALLIFGHADPSSASLHQIADKLSLGRTEIYIPFIFVAYTIGHFLSYVSSITVERYSIWALGYPSKYLMGYRHSGYFSPKELPFIRVPLRGLIAVLLLPVSLLDCILGLKAHMRELYAKSLDGLLIGLLRGKVAALVREEGGITQSSEPALAIEDDYFTYAYHYAVEYAPNHLPKMQNYVALYGFLRTVTLLSVLLFWVAVWHVIYRPLPLPTAAYLLAATSVMSFFFYMAFVKFYRRFSLEALMAVAVSFRAKTGG